MGLTLASAEHSVCVYTWYGCGQVFPLAPVVSEPVARILALTGKRRAGNDEGTLICDLPQSTERDRCIRHDPIRKCSNTIQT